MSGPVKEIKHLTITPTHSVGGWAGSKQTGAHLLLLVVLHNKLAGGRGQEQGTALANSPAGPNQLQEAPGTLHPVSGAIRHIST